jgi:preprotein translocase SecE subunit
VAVKEKDTLEQPTVTRISARDTRKPAKKAQPKAAAKEKPAQEKPKRTNPFRIFATLFSGTIGYFTGAWFELKQVRWPNRRSTWSMTGALLGFTAFFVVFILLMDALFEYLFKLVLG